MSRRAHDRSVIRMSRSGGVPPRALGARAASFLHSHAWHVGCIPLVAGCLYTAPVWREEVNEPPVIIQPDTTSENPLVLFADRTEFVIAADPEGNPIEFVWDVPGYPDLPHVETQQDQTVVSRAVIPRDEALDGVLIRVLVIDQVPPFGFAEAQFRVEVP